MNKLYRCVCKKFFETPLEFREHIEAQYPEINYKLKNRDENDGWGPVSGTVTLIRE